MAEHRFTVNIPNPESRAETVQLHLGTVTRTALMKLSLDIPDSDLAISNAGITLDPCSCQTVEKLRLKLEPHSSADVHIVVTTKLNPKGGATALHLIDERKGGQAGGVMLVCVENAGAETAGQLIVPTNPCPIVLSKDPYPVPLGEDPKKKPAGKGLTAGKQVLLVAPVTNPTGHVLAGVNVYLEHLGSSGVQFTPMTWNVGGLAAGDVFFAVWEISVPVWTKGVFEGSVVVASASTEPVRLRCPLHILDQSE